MRTRRVPTPITNATYSILSSTVSTVTKPVARMPAACARRNARHVAGASRGAGGRWRRRSTARILVADTAIPSLRSARPPRRAGQRPAQRGEQHPVRRPVLDPLHLAAQHRDLMLQHEDLEFLGGVAAGSPVQQGHQAARAQIRADKGGQHHQTMIPNARRRSMRGPIAFLHPTGLVCRPVAVRATCGHPHHKNPSPAGLAGAAAG